MSEKKVPQSTFGRASRLFLSGAKIASREVAGRLAAKLGSQDEEAVKLKTKIRQSQELVEALSQLKGAAMKAGQLLSLEFSDMLPPEVTEILRKLHDSGTFMHFDQVRYILRRELGPDRFSLLEELTPEPVAAASIGQVHRAIVGGEPVAVKVQFPGVASTIDSDLNALRRLANAWLQFRGKDIQLDAFFQELADSMRREADYLKEADSIEFYRERMRNPAFVMPRVYRELTTTSVLTMSFEDGVRLADWLKSKPGRAEGQMFARLVIDLLIEEFYVNGLVQTDPNYGNFLIRPAAGQIVLLDFGATNSYDRVFREELRALLAVAIAGDHARVLELIFADGFLDPRESDAAKALFLELLDAIIRLFRPESQPFRFADERYLRDIREVSFKFVQALQFSPPAKRLALLNRKIGGMFHLLKDLDVQLDMTPFVERALTVPIA